MLSLPQDFLNFTTYKLVTNIHDAERDKRQRKTFHRLQEPPENSSKTGRCKFQKKRVEKNPEILPQVSGNIEPIIFHESQFKKIELEFSLLLRQRIYITQNTEVCSATSCLDNNRKKLHRLWPNSLIPLLKYQSEILFTHNHSPSIFYTFIKNLIKNDQINKTANYQKRISNQQHWIQS